jgi:hypothetical protein
VLERLQSRDVIQWIREPDAIHITVMPRGQVLLHPPKAHVEHAHSDKVKPKHMPKPKDAKVKPAKSKPHVAPKPPHARAKHEGVFSTFARVFGSLRF